MDFAVQSGDPRDDVSALHKTVFVSPKTSRVVSCACFGALLETVCLTEAPYCLVRRLPSCPVGEAGNVTLVAEGRIGAPYLYYEPKDQCRNNST